MSQKNDLKAIEKKVYTSFHQDGLIDLFLGFIMLVAILSSTLDASGISDSIRIAIYVPLMVIIGPLLFMQLKKHITFPRMGYVKLGSKQKRKRRIIIFAIINAVLLTLIILTFFLGNKAGKVGSALGMKAELWSSGFVTLIIIGIFGIIGFVLMVPRFFLLGIIVGLSEPLYVFARHHTNIKYVGLIAYGIPGVLLFILGAVVLRRFLKTHSLLKAGDADYQVE